MAEEQKFTAGDGAASDFLGASVAISGDGNTAFIGAYGDDSAGLSNTGSVYVERWNGSEWETSKLLAPDRAAGDSFGYATALSYDGNTALVGAHLDDDFGSSSGSAYIYRWADGQWTTTKLNAPDGAVGDQFGSSVALSDAGNVALVGSHYDDDLGASSGSAYVYRETDAGWLVSKLTASDGAAGDNFGFSVSISGDGATALIGANLDDDKGSNSGSAYIYRWDGAAWQQSKLMATDGGAGDNFGYSTAISADGNTAVVGAYGDDDRGGNAGAAYVYRWDGTSWVETKLTAPDAASGDNFGISVALSDDGNTALVGSRYDDDHARNAGAAYIYHWNGASWDASKLTAPDAAASDAFGTAVALSGDGERALIGVKLDDDHGTSSGSAYLMGTGPGGPAVLVRERFTTDEDTPINDTLLVDAASDDPDADPLPPDVTFALSADPASQPHHGTVAVSAEGFYTYTPGDELQAMASGETLQDSFTVVVTDSRGVATEQVVTITISGVNDAPTISGDVDIATGQSAAAQALLVATDPENQAVSFALSAALDDAAPAYGVVQVDADGSYTYRPNAGSLAGGATLNDSFTVVATDSQGAQTKQLVHVSIVGENQAPVVGDADITVVTDEDHAVAGALVATDAEGQLVTFTLSDVPDAQPLQGSVEVSADGTYLFRPAAALQALSLGDVVEDSFVVRADDANGGVAERTVTVSIAGANDGPTAADDVAFAVENGDAVALAVLANDDDVDGDDDAGTLTVVSAESASGVQISGIGAAGGSLIYDVAGTDAFEHLGSGETTVDTVTYTVADRHGATTTAAVAVTVTGVNDGPSIVAADASGEIAEAAAWTAGVVHERAGVIAFSDADLSDTHFVSVAAHDGGYLGGLAADVVQDAGGEGSIAWSFAVADADLDHLGAGERLVQSYDVAIVDGHGGTAVQTVAITLDGSNDAPVIVAPGSVIGGTIAEAAQADAAAGLDHITAGRISFTDIDLSDSHRIGVTPGGADYLGTFVPTLTEANGSGAVTWSLQVADADLDSLGQGETRSQTYTVEILDASGASVSQVVTVDLVGTNDDPVAVGDAAKVLEHQAVVIDVMANDHDADARDTMEIVSVSSTRYGASVSTDGHTITYLADADDFDLMHDGDRLADSFTYTIRDSAGALSTATVEMQVHGVNDGSVIHGTNHADLLIGTSGSDTIDGGNGNDLVWGREGADVVFGGNGDDIIYGDRGRDELHGDNGNDWLIGGAGNDTLDGGRGNDLLTGGDGIDIFLFGKSSGNDVISDFSMGEDVLRLADAMSVRRMVEISTDGDRIADSTRIDFSDGGTVVLSGVTDIHDWHQLIG